ncbi:MAG: DUF1989 domain-containing protein [Solirubrobacterales bacterium]
MASPATPGDAATAPAHAEVSLTRQQAELLDRAVEELAAGSRGEALLRAMRDQALSPLAGGPGNLGGAASVESVARQRRERIGPRAPLRELVLAPGTGKAIELERGQILCVEQIEGGQCADFNCFNLDDYREHLHAAGTRTRHGLHPRCGDLLWSRPPRERPMMAIVEDTAGAIDTLFPRCSAWLYQAVLGLSAHPSCQDIQAEAQREYRLTPDDVHDSVNLFMYTGVDADGRPFILPNRSRAGDRVELLALIDVLAVPNVCADDAWPTSNFDQRSLRVAVYEGGAEALARFEARPELAPLTNQRAPDDLGRARVRTETELRRDPEYEAAFGPSSAERVPVAVRLSERDRELVDTLIGSGGFGAGAGEVLRACFMLSRVEAAG